MRIGVDHKLNAHTAGEINVGGIQVQAVRLASAGTAREKRSASEESEAAERSFI